MNFINSNAQEPHLLFIGRWCPLHQGHTAIIKTVRAQKKLPVLILVRDTKFDEISAQDRAELIKTWLQAEEIPGSVVIIPDIEGVYYGRGVGYNIEEIVVEAGMASISWHRNTGEDRCWRFKLGRACRTRDCGSHAEVF